MAPPVRKSVCREVRRHGGYAPFLSQSFRAPFDCQALSSSPSRSPRRRLGAERPIPMPPRSSATSQRMACLGAASPRRSAPVCWRARQWRYSYALGPAGIRPLPPCIVARSDGSAARAPWISILRRYLSPRLLIRNSFVLPPVLNCLGTSPSPAAKSRACSKASPRPIAAISVPTSIPSKRCSRSSRRCSEKSRSAPSMAYGEPSPTALLSSHDASAQTISKPQDMSQHERKLP